MRQGYVAATTCQVDLVPGISSSLSVRSLVRSAEDTVRARTHEVIIGTWWFQCSVRARREEDDDGYPWRDIVRVLFSKCLRYPYDNRKVNLWRERERCSSSCIGTSVEVSRGPSWWTWKHENVSTIYNIIFSSMEGEKEGGLALLARNLLFFFFSRSLLQLSCRRIWSNQYSYSIFIFLAWYVIN